MTQTKKPFTHNAYIWKQYGPPRRGTSQRPGWWQGEGKARIEEKDGEIFIFLHSTPIGGFDGRIRCVEIGKPQPEAPDWAEIAAAESEAEPGRSES
jgi:hypothetical protein